jgi:hypothetical protein
MNESNLCSAMYDEPFAAALLRSIHEYLYICIFEFIYPYMYVRSRTDDNVNKPKPIKNRFSASLFTVPFLGIQEK